ncbi:MAG: tetratricopeptide repeat protein [Verrucomicrobia bacterium]|nr:tetratricopeptide repeat protein [Verrucomicrobiota bacterium]
MTFDLRLAPFDTAEQRSAVPMISTRRHLEYASGYLALGLVDEAARELNRIRGADRKSAKVLGVRVDLHVEARQWVELLDVACELARVAPDDDKGFIFTAYALKELGRVAEARDVLTDVESRFPKCALLHYNLACYHCVLGQLPEARRRLAMAFKLHADWKTSALEDEDLQPLWPEIAKMRMR